MSKNKMIGRRIAWLRAHKEPRVNQEDLAAELGIARSTIASIESGKDSPGLSTAISIADYFKVSLDWLLYRQVPPGGPLTGKFVDDPDELAWLDFWRGLDDGERHVVIRLLSVGDRRRGQLRIVDKQ